MPSVPCNKILYNNELNMRYIFKQINSTYIEITIIGPFKGGLIVYNKLTVPIGTSIPI